MRQLSDPSRRAAPPVSSAPLRKLVWRKATKAFLTGEGTWTRNIRKACHFADLFAAQAASRLPGTDIALYYSFDPDKPSPYDFTLSFV